MQAFRPQPGRRLPFCPRPAESLHRTLGPAPLLSRQRPERFQVRAFARLPAERQPSSTGIPQEQPESPGGKGQPAPRESPRPSQNPAVSGFPLASAAPQKCSPQNVFELSPQDSGWPSDSGGHSTSRADQDKSAI